MMPKKSQIIHSVHSAETEMPLTKVYTREFKLEALRLLTSS